MNQSSTLCRVCACDGTTLDLINIFEKRGQQQCIAEMLLELAGLKVSVDDQLPRLCCTPCQSDLISAVALRRKCIESDKMMHACFECSFSESDNDSIYSEKDENISTLEDAIYYCNECSVDFYDSATLQRHYESKHAYAIYGWKSFGVSEIAMFDTSTEEEDDNVPAIPEKKNWQRAPVPNCICCGCSMVFDTEPELKLHAEAVHAPLAMQTDAERPFQCNICYHTFTTPRGVSEHQYTKRMLRYQCTTCGKRFGKYYQLLKHEVTHINESFPCDRCEKHFGNLPSLQKHKTRQHASSLTGGAKQHICNDCGKRMHSAEYLKQHMKLHSTHGAYSCPLCDARFKLKVYLTWHIAKHKGTYNCNQCHKTFKSSSELQMHSYRHSDQRDFECGVCGKSFYTPIDRTRHIHKVHKKSKRKEK
uniref:Protein krueppel n=1 Tax=Anopheles dirus TaxID=7168 RepID=A0A182NYQ5_9DIPT